ncbi:MerR family transcriptional regulator [Bacillus taeanensis]|uniref:MerR family transcriptional regulator n=1 Tax=Bacillus taeanensis TaxID=273032 RepID=UPI00248219CE|nr:MerR family transcriptional regulator [Bacillus taeanensis]
MGELASITNVSKRTIDYYTQIGLLNPERTASNYRLYREESIHILELVEHYKKLNMPLDEIKTAIGLIKSNDGADDCKVEKHMEQIADIMKHLETEIKEIKPLLENLDEKQHKVIMNKLAPRGTALSQTLLLLFG